MNKQEIEKAISKLAADIGVLENYLKIMPVSIDRCFENELIKDMQFSISTLTKQLNNGWISCKLRQPSNEESIKRRGEFVIQSARVKLPYTATWNRSKKLWQDEEGYQLDYVIAWQPLPESYKEESE